MGGLKRIFWILLGCGSIVAGALFVDSSPAVPPAIWWFHPLAGTPGTRVRILGKGFSDTTLVTFGGTRAPFTLMGPLAIQATVPPGAARGPITVTTPMGTASSSEAFLFRIRAWASM
jgi:hypothetical protein